MITLSLTEEQTRLVREALLAYISDFGHDEAEILQHAHRVLAEVERALTAPTINVGTPAGS